MLDIDEVMIIAFSPCLPLSLSPPLLVSPSPCHRFEVLEKIHRSDIRAGAGNDGSVRRGGSVRPVCSKSSVIKGNCNVEFGAFLFRRWRPEGTKAISPRF